MCSGCGGPPRSVLLLHPTLRLAGHFINCPVGYDDHQPGYASFKAKAKQSVPGVRCLYLYGLARCCLPAGSISTD